MADSLTELKAALKCDGLKNIYYIYGKDIVSVEAAYKFIRSKAVKSEDEVYNLHTFDGMNFNLDEFTDACEALPMFADHVLCAVNDLDAEKLKADEFSILTEAVSDLPETTILVFYYTGHDVTNGKKVPTTKNKKICDIAAKKGKVYNFETKTPEILAKEIISKISRNGSSISKENAILIANLCCNNSLAINNEIDKLIAYCGQNEITSSDIELLCPKQTDTKTYLLANAIMRKEKHKSMSLLNDLKLEMTEPIQIIYAVSSSMIDMYRAKIAISNRKNYTDVMNDFKYIKTMDFKVKKAFQDVKYYSVRDLRKCLKILTETDVAMKSSKADKMILLEEAIVKMLSLK